MLRPSKRTHAIHFADKDHSEAQSRMLEMTRQNAEAKRLVTRNVERLRENESLAPTVIEEIASGALGLVQAEQEPLLREQANLVIEKMMELAEAEAMEDIFTCCRCGQDFANGRHTDMLIVSVIEFDESGRAYPERIDLGINEVVHNNMGRRIKICQPCISEFAIHPKDYVNMR